MAINCTVKHFEWSSRLEKCYIKTDHLPFTVSHCIVLRGLLNIQAFSVAFAACICCVTGVTLTKFPKEAPKPQL